jgi:hypothetical protein
MAPSELRALSEDLSGTPIVTVDFRGGRPERDFSDLAAIANRNFARCTFFELPVEFISAHPPEPTPSEWASVFRAQVLAREFNRPLVIAGYCAAAPSAHELASTLHRHLQVDGVVLFNASQVKTSDVELEFRSICRRIGVTPDSLPKDRTEALSSFQSTIHQGIEQLVKADGTAGNLYQELEGRYISWLSFLFAATQSPSYSFPGQILHVTSPGVAIRGDLPANDIRRREVMSDHANLLGSVATWDAVREETGLS